MNKIPITIVGAGVMGTNHARVVAASEKAELVCVIDPFESTGTKLANAHSAKWFPDTKSIPTNSHVIIASATESHFEIATQLINNGQNLLIEKPLTDTLNTTNELVSLSNQSNTVLMCGLLERYNPAVLTAEKLFQNPIHISAIRHSPFTPRIKTHVAWDLMIHDIDLVLRIAGKKPDSIRSISTNTFSDNKVPDMTDALLGFNGSSQAFVSANRSGQRKIRSLSVSESDKLIEVDLLRRNVTVYHNVQESALPGGHGYKQESIIEIPELITSVEPLTAQFNNFLSLICGEIDPAPERSSYLSAHEVIHEIVESSIKAS